MISAEQIEAIRRWASTRTTVEAVVDHLRWDGDPAEVLTQCVERLCRGEPLSDLVVEPICYTLSGASLAILFVEKPVLRRARALSERELADAALLAIFRLAVVGSDGLPQTADWEERAGVSEGAGGELQGTDARKSANDILLAILASRPEILGPHERR